MHDLHDLDILINKTIDFKLNGEIIKVNQPSLKTVKKIRAFYLLNDEEQLEEQTNLVVELLNNNTSSKKFKNTDVEKLPVPVLGSIFKTIVQAVNGIETNPN